MGFWLFAEKGCVATPAASSVLGSTTTGAEQPLHAVSMGPRQSSRSATDLSLDRPSESKSRSIKRASILLRKASEILGKDERLAVRFIRQAIAILKHEAIIGLEGPDYDRVSNPSADGDGTDEVRLLEKTARCSHDIPHASLQSCGHEADILRSVDRAAVPTE
jgi:hypothetical protein